MARERTQLARTRTAISVASLGGAITKIDPVIGLPILAVSALICVACHCRPPGPSPRGSRGRSLLTAGAIVCVCAAALTNVLLNG
ncbi:hypothetical protein [Actinoallomurus sp. NPDC050550]|uniref:hypothetical protein n=1 Tax=Actinoallomurus sp. NPDC050550 TaxID=3154937 RepID=UPI0033D94CAD